MQGKTTKSRSRATARSCASLLLGVAAALPWAVHAQGTSLTEVTTPVVYSDGRPYPPYRMDATVLGRFLEYGQAPNQTDYLGIREAQAENRALARGKKANS
jgi:hypothetical protein